MQPIQTLPELLIEAGIRLKHWTPGHTEHLDCPKCGGGNHHDRGSLAVTIDPDGDGATWICHRGSCAWTDGIRTGSAARARPSAPAAPRKPVSHSVAAETNRPDWLYQFFAERQIGARTVHAFGCYAVDRRFGDVELPAMVFPYRWHGEVVNRKYRARGEKRGQQQEAGALPTLFNVDRLGDAPAEIVWVEGEPDVMALFECGIERAVSLKDGAPSEAKFNPEDKRFEALRTHADMLAKVKRIVLAGDMDGPGLALREELARRLGRHRCWLVTWPDGCKDACDVLRAYGPDGVTSAIAGAEPYPIDGLQRITADRLLALRRLPPPGTMTTGTRSTDLVLRLPTEGRLIVVTGVPNHGKTSWTRFVMVHTATDHGRRWAVFSPEMQPWEHFAAQCAEVYLGKPFWPTPGYDSMTDPEIVEAGRWLGDRITMLVCDSEDEAPTMDWLLERARAAVLRDGVTDLLIDPWNEVDQTRGSLSETEFIGRSLQRFKAFGLRHGCNVWLIAHPAKPSLLKSGEKRPAPGPYDISGSSHWANKPDLGLTLHSPDLGGSELHLWKSRMRRWGKRGSVAAMDYNEVTGCYSTPISEMVRETTA